MKHQSGDSPAWSCVSLYLWQQVGDELFVLCVEPFHDVAETLESRLRGEDDQQNDRVKRSRESLVLLRLRFRFSFQSGSLTLFAGEEAFFNVSSRTTLSVSRFSTTNERHASVSPPHISSSTRYAFFCMPGSLVWGMENRLSVSMTTVENSLKTKNWEPGTVWNSQTNSRQDVLLNNLVEHQNS